MYTRERDLTPLPLPAINYAGGGVVEFRRVIESRFRRISQRLPQPAAESGPLAPQLYRQYTFCQQIAAAVAAAADTQGRGETFFFGRPFLFILPNKRRFNVDPARRERKSLEFYL